MQAHTGSQEARKNLHSASKGLLNKVGTLFATMNTSHAELINSLRQTERLTDKTADAMLQVDRKYFLDPDNVEALHLAYQVSLSIPWLHTPLLLLPCYGFMLLGCFNRITLFQ